MSFYKGKNFLFIGILYLLEIKHLAPNVIQFRSTAISVVVLFWAILIELISQIITCTTSTESVTAMMMSLRQKRNSQQQTIPALNGQKGKAGL